MLEDRDACAVKYESYRSWKWNVGNLFIAAVMDSPFSRTDGETILLYVTADHNIFKFADTPISMSWKMLIPCPCSNLTSIPFYYGHDRYISFCYASAFRCRRHYIFSVVHMMSVRRGFRTFPGKRKKGMASNLACCCIQDTFTTD